MGSHKPQMLGFRVADLEAQQEGLYAYTSAPAHSLKSVTASARSFLDYSRSPSPSPAQETDSNSQHDALLSGLHIELDGYLSEPRMDPTKVIDNATVQYCDPLLYWAVSIFAYFLGGFSTVHIGC